MINDETHNTGRQDETHDLQHHEQRPDPLHHEDGSQRFGRSYHPTRSYPPRPPARRDEDEDES